MTLATDQLNSRGLRISGSATRELANSAMGRENLIPLWFGEPDQSTPQFICDSAAKALKNGETFYTEGLGKPFLREAIATYQNNLYDCNMATDRIAVTLSGGNALNLAFQSILDDGDKMVTTLPSFPNLLAIPALQGADVQAVNIRPTEDGWKLDIDEFLDRAKGAKVVLLNSPNNPTGWTLNHDEQRYILDELRNRGTWIIADDVYSRLYYDGKAAPAFLEISQPEDRLIVVNSFSKAWAMTGWRIGWLTLPASLTPTVEKLMEYSAACVPAFTQHAALSAITKGEDFIETSNQRYLKSLEVVSKRLSEFPNIKFPRPNAAFYAYFQINGVTDNMAYARKILDETGVGLAPGIAFDPDAKDWFRLCFANSTDRINEAFDRMTPLLLSQ
ncbi:MAG: pyridoxal phosphate-dependent aminotransferase [Kordiimonadaceae bacterium]|jgi:aspartate/methionine/tyrosine aminotransferase|nr:pyridoxal phosphate-dependent aminotransferase [Kordiimonadaceae bacterium]MBT6031056.1 pyridoxal phosphate-dependent aminotransferase [Kordiimonadaceae bacterium]